MRRLLILMVLVAAMPGVWAGVTCSVCGRSIKGKYIKAGGKAFCSKRCYVRSLPTCAVCGQVIHGQHVTSEGKHYCSTHCFETTLPKCEICGKPLRHAFNIEGHYYCETHSKGPFCCKCRLPVGKGFDLPDGRVICAKCNPGVIYEYGQAYDLYQRAAKEVRAATGLRSESLPPLELVGLDRMPDNRRRGGTDSLIQRGMYYRKTETTTRKNVFGWKISETKSVTESVLLLYGLTPEEVISTAAHELTHDLIAEFFPRIEEDAPQWVEEGICQYVAAMVCRKNRFADILERIETSELSDYGDGYRYIKKKVGDDQWDKLAEWMRTGDMASLPDVAPPSPPTRQDSRRVGR